MKKFFLILVCLISFGITTKGQSYILIKSILADKTDIKGEEKKGSEILEEKWLFRIVIETKEYKIISILPFKDSKDDDGKIYTLNKRVAYTEDLNDKSVKTTNYFKLTLAEFGEVARKVEERFGFGTIILPIKLRFGDTDSQNKNLRYFDFTSEVNVGLSIAWRMSSPRSRVIDTHLIGSLNLSSIAVDSANTRGFQKTSTKISALSPTVGLLFNFKNSGLQLITSVGLDLMAGELGKKWIYRNQPWIGIGIGFSIFKFGDKGSSTDKQAAPTK
jgi:hypothetical protein